MNAKKTKASAEVAPVAKPLALLSQEWARAKQQEELGRREANKKREELLEAGATIGYSDDFLEIGPHSDVALEDERIERALKAEGVLEEALETKLSLEKVRAIAKLKPRVARAVEAATTTKPRFLQASKKV